MILTCHLWAQINKLPIEIPEFLTTLELPDLSEMLGRWLDIVGIQKVSVMGMSLGSVVASCFAYHRPDLMDRMMGVMQRPVKAGG